MVANLHTSLAVMMLLSVGLSSGQGQEKKVGDLTKAEWIELLEKNENPNKRRGAVIALGLFGAEQTDNFALLKKALSQDKAPEVRLQVIVVFHSTLSNSTIQRELPLFADVMKGDKSPLVRAKTLQLVSRLGKDAKPTLSTLIEMLKDEDATVRSETIVTISKIGEEAKSAVDAIAPLVKDADSHVRTTALFALGRIAGDVAPIMPRLLEALEKDADAEVRREAARTLARFGPSAKLAITPLINTLKMDKNAEVREESALTLGKMGADLAPFVETLKEMAKSDKDKIVRLYLVRSLSAALGSGLKAHAKDLGAMLGTEKDGEVKIALIQELGHLGTDAKDALEAVQRAQGDAQVAVRMAAIDAVKRIEGTVPPKK